MENSEKKAAAKDLLTIDEAATLLGQKPARVRKLVSTGRLRNRRCCCRTARVRRADVEAVVLPEREAEPSGADVALREILALCRAVRAGEAKPRKTMAEIEAAALAGLREARLATEYGREDAG